MTTNKEDIEKWVKDAMSNRNINKYTFDISGSSSVGDGYLGNISFIKVVADLGKGKEKIYNLVVKYAKDNDELRKKSAIAETYQREIHVYTEVFPAIDQLQKEYAIENTFTNYPLCFSSCKLDKKEALVLENLKSLGYVVHDRTITQNYDHALLVFRTYAKWHGASLALKLKKPKIFKKITDNMTDLMGEFLIKSGMFNIFKNSFQKGLDLLKENGKEEAAKKIQNEAGDIIEILAKMTLTHDVDAETEAVILHGDCWNNNMMFKYAEKDTSKPIDMFFIDFQISRLASPILDLSYYLYATGEKSTLEKLDYLLEEYHKELTIYLKQYDINVNDTLSLDRLKSSWKKYGRFGLGMIGFIIRAELSETNEVIDFTGKIGDGTIIDYQMDEIKKQKEYERRIYNIFNHFAEKFL